MVTRERRPVSLAIVLDSSGSMDMDHRRSLALESARRALGALAPGDEAAVVLFAQRPEVVVPWTTAAQLPQVLESFVNDSGGMLSYVNNASELVAAIQRMSADWNNQYTLGYTPSKPFDGKYRKIKVEAKRRGVSVRHRGGYLALPAHQ